MRHGDWKLVMNPQQLFDGYWDVNDVVLAPGQNESEIIYLFNISNDEIESINLKDVYPNIVQDFQDRLDEVKSVGFTMSNDIFELEGFVIALLSGAQLPYLEITQEIKIDLD